MPKEGIDAMWLAPTWNIFRVESANLVGALRYLSFEAERVEKRRRFLVRMESQVLLTHMALTIWGNSYVMFGIHYSTDPCRIFILVVLCLVWLVRWYIEPSANRKLQASVSPLRFN